MKNFLLFITLAFSLSGLSKSNTLEEHEGQYLGLGNYVSTQDRFGSYPSYVEITPNIWSLAYVMNDSLLRYDAFFEPDENGFFDTLILRSTEGKESIFDGFGYCLDNYCHLSAVLDDNPYEETITFLENNRIKRVGSLRYQDEDGNPHTMRWVENLVNLSPNVTGETR